jgi:hypothetical protein
MGNQEISSVGGRGIPIVSRGIMFAFAIGLAFGQGRPAEAARTPSDPSPAGAPDRLSFDVASVKPDNSTEDPDSNFPLGAGDVYTPNGGFFSATNFPLVAYIAFAYKLRVDQTSYLLPELPAWTGTERFDIQARCEGNPSKDEMRLMMRSMLADRFKLVVHHETRQLPVLEVVLAKPGKTGPQLQPHSNDWVPEPIAPSVSRRPIADAAVGTPISRRASPSVQGHLLTAVERPWPLPRRRERRDRPIHRGLL